MSVAAQLCLAAAAGLWWLCFVGARRGRRISLPETGWIVAVAFWPYFVSLVLGPLLWGSPDAINGTSYALVRYAPALAIGIGIALERARKGSKLTAPAILTIVAFVLVSPFVVGVPGEILNLLFPFALLVGVMYERPRPISMEGVGWAIRLVLALLATSLFWMIFAHGDIILGPCREDKCGISGVSLVSSFTGNGNVYGLVFVLLMPLAGIGLGFFGRATLIIVVLVIADICLSRTAYLGLAVGAAGLLLMLDRNWSRLWARIGTSVLFCAAVVVSLVPVVSRFGDSEFRWRGVLWRVAKGMIEQSPLVGYGPQGWTAIGQDGAFNPSYSPHNIWLSWMICGGLVCVLLMVAVVATSIMRLSGEARTGAMVFVSAVVAVGTLEMPFDLLSLRLTPFVGLMLLYLAASCGEMNRRSSVRLLQGGRSRAAHWS